MKDFNPISLIETSVTSLRDYLEKVLDTQIENQEEKIVNEVFFKEISAETIHLLSLCKELNSEEVFIEKLNLCIHTKNPNVLYKSEQFFLSDIINIYNTNSVEKSAQSKFVLAYYYDVLRNNHFADEKALIDFNKLIKAPEFTNVISEILSKNSLKTGHNTKANLLLSTLKSLNHPKLAMMQNHFQNFRRMALLVGEDLVETSTTTAVYSQENVINPNISFPPENDSIEKVMQELEQMVGLEKVKEDITKLINLLNIQKKREAEGLKNIDIALHTVFLGPPGTGKTTIARLLSRIFKHLGYLSKGQLYETDREGLVAGYVGQTAIKTDKVLEESFGGVLFIDEAYSLTNDFLGNDFGSEAVNTIIKRMEDHRDDLAVVVAGYTEPMQLFIESNPGLRSRFNRYFTFDHFSTDQLFLIFENFCKNSDFVLSEDAKEKLKDTFAFMEDYKSESFGNARVVRNLFEKVVQNQADRLINLSNLQKEDLTAICQEDIPEPSETIDGIKTYKKEETAE